MYKPIEIPKHLLKKADEITDRYEKLFKTRKLKEPKYLGWAKCGSKALSFWAEKHDKYSDGSPDYNSMGSIDYGKKIALYRISHYDRYNELFQRYPLRLLIKATLIHEIAHALDDDPRRTFYSEKMPFDKYVCRQTEFRSEMAAVRYVLLPFYLDCPLYNYYAQQFLKGSNNLRTIDYFTSNFVNVWSDKLFFLRLLRIQARQAAEQEIWKY